MDRMDRFNYKGGKMNIKEQQKLADRQDYLVDRLTNGEEEFLDMLEEFYDISITLNGLAKKEEK